MQESFLQFFDTLNNATIRTSNKNLDEVLEDYRFYFISGEDQTISQKKEIINNFNESDIIIIKYR